MVKWMKTVDLAKGEKYDMKTPLQICLDTVYEETSNTRSTSIKGHFLNVAGSEQNSFSSSNMPLKLFTCMKNQKRN